MASRIPGVAAENDLLRNYAAAVRIGVGTIRTRLRSGGIILVSLRDYGPLIVQRTPAMPAKLYSDGKLRRFVHHLGLAGQSATMFVMVQMADGWHTQHFVGRYRAITPSDVAALAVHAGFDDVRVLPCW